MKNWVCGLLATAFLTGCSNFRQDIVRTEIETFPSRAKIEVNGKYLGRSPVIVVLPQANRQLEGRTIIKATPDDENLHSQLYIFDPETRTNPIPVRVSLELARIPDLATNEQLASLAPEIPDHTQFKLPRSQTRHSRGGKLNTFTTSAPPLENP
ncbi:MAG: PEGA domain-containing protein [Verrucomicrobiota bacterium]|nr:PEGA domain-containing protein [Verrucomicrobiota bacterium]